MDEHWVHVPGGRRHLEATDEAIYLVYRAAERVGSGLAVLDRWDFYPDRQMGGDASVRDPGEFHRLTRDIYVPASDMGFWQGVFREPSDPIFAIASRAITERQMMTIDLLYGDHEGGQRTISRFAILPAGEDQWLATVARHWNLDRANPR